MNLRRRAELAFYRMKGYFPGAINGKPYKFVPEDRKFWRRVAREQWEPHTFVILEKCLHRDAVYLDIGGWIGPTVLFAAQQCKQVYCVEPDPVAYERLLANLRLNGVGNVFTFHGAIGDKTGFIKIANEEGFGNSETRVLEHSHGDSTTVLAMDFAEYIRCFGIDRIDLIKIDIEGAEFNLMPSLIKLVNQMKPTIYLSLHAPLFPKEERRSKLESVIELAGHYRYHYDKNLKKIEPSDILQTRFTDKYSEVLLSDSGF